MTNPDHVLPSALGPVPTRARLPATRMTVLLLAALAAVGQFASNVYTPSLPAVARDLGVSEPAAQITFAAFLATFAVAQLAYGPIADRLGRRPALLAGLVLFLVGTVACALASTLEALILARMAQAAGAAAGLVVSRAATRDSFEGEALARTLAAVTIAFALVPGLTPLLGGLTQATLGWRATFWLTLAIGVGTLAWTFLRLPETRRPGPAPEGVLRDYATVLRDRVFGGTAVTAGLVFGGAIGAFTVGAVQLSLPILAMPLVMLGAVALAIAVFALTPAPEAAR